MTESEWNTCQNPHRMLEFLRITGKARERKLKLFAVAACRSIWNLIAYEPCRNAIEGVENYADNGATDMQLAGVFVLSLVPRDRRDTDPTFTTAVFAITDPQAEKAAAAASNIPHIVGGCSLLRDIFPWPFQEKPAIASEWLAWNDGTVKRLAEAAYQERSLPDGRLDNARLAVLADALLDAGCADTELMVHLRGPGPHTRGCWAIDVLTGRE